MLIHFTRQIHKATHHTTTSWDNNHNLVQNYHNMQCAMLLLLTECPIHPAHVSSDYCHHTILSSVHVCVWIWASYQNAILNRFGRCSEIAYYSVPCCDIKVCAGGWLSWLRQSLCLFISIWNMQYQVDTSISQRMYVCVCVWLVWFGLYVIESAPTHHTHTHARKYSARESTECECCHQNKH